jgi:hypothetical protein
MRTLRANLWKIYSFKFIAEFFLVVPVLVPYYVFHKLNATQIFTIQATFHLAVLLLEIPSGYLADVIGRKKTLFLGALFSPLGLGLYAFTGTFISFVLAEFSFAVAVSMRSGCESAFIYDTLLVLGEEAAYKKYEGRAFFFTRVGTATAAVGGGLLAMASLHLPFYVNLATCSLMIPIAFSFREPGRKRLETASPWKDIVRISRRCFTHRRLRLYILLYALLGSASVIGVWAYFLYFRRLGLSLLYYGIIFAAFQLASAFGSRQAHVLAAKLGERYSLWALLVIGLIFLSLGAFSSRLLVALIMIAAFVWGYGFPVLLDSMNKLIPSEARATMLSVAGMTLSLSFVILSPLFGRVVDAFSLTTAFMALGVFYLITGTIILTALSRNRDATPISEFPGAK